MIPIRCSKTSRANAMTSKLREYEFSKHMVELRNRLMLSVLVIIVGFAVSFYYCDDIFIFLTKPLLRLYPHNKTMIFTSLTEGFSTSFKLSLYTSFMITFPFIALQVYLFISPGLYKKEKMIFAPLMLISPLLFLLGAAVAYYVVMPAAWKFFLSFEKAKYIVLEAKISDYLDLSLDMIIAFGMAFQLPIILLVLCKFGLITAGTLVKGRRYAIVLIFIIAAVLTPPDVISQILLAIPLILLYEISVVMCRLIERKKSDA